MTKIKTITLQGKEYAQVKDRLAEFREQCPNGLIETNPTIQADGNVIFKARILKDKSDENSAEATGHAMGMNKGVKAFEKLETIAVGRALALLGFATNGDIASSEEMEEFMEYKKTQKEEVVFDLMSKVDEITSIEELRKFYTENKGLGKELDEYITKKSKELKNANS